MDMALPWSVGTAAVSYYYSERHMSQSPEHKRSISPFGVGPNKKKAQVSLLHRQTLFFFSFVPCPCFQSTIFFRDFTEAKRPRELRIQDSSERLQRQETREVRIQSPEDFNLFLFFSLLWVMTSVFFWFVFLTLKKKISLYIMFWNYKY